MRKTRILLGISVLSLIFCSFVAVDLQKRSPASDEESSAFNPFVDSIDSVIYALNDENRDGQFLVYLGASWCNPCHTLYDSIKDDILPQLDERIEVFFVDYDQWIENRYLNQRLGEFKGIPHLILFEKNNQFRRIYSNRESIIQAINSNVIKPSTWRFNPNVLETYSVPSEYIETQTSSIFDSSVRELSTFLYDESNSLAAIALVGTDQMYGASEVISNIESTIKTEGYRARVFRINSSSWNSSDFASSCAFSESEVMFYLYEPGEKWCVAFGTGAVTEIESYQRNGSMELLNISPAIFELKLNGYGPTENL